MELQILAAFQGKRDGTGIDQYLFSLTRVVFYGEPEEHRLFSS
jgi:hypothetical protein